MMEDTIPCISLHKPWAMWVIMGWKPIETRTHERFKKLVDRRIGIHAAERWDKNWFEKAGKYLTPAQVNETHGWRGQAKYRFGNLLGTVLVRKHRHLFAIDSSDALIDCTVRPGRLLFGLVVSEPHPLNMPILMKGQRGIFYVPAIR
jgi:hypothetical protein